MGLSSSSWDTIATGYHARSQSNFAPAWAAALACCWCCSVAAADEALAATDERAANARCCCSALAAGEALAATDEARAANPCGWPAAAHAADAERCRLRTRPVACVNVRCSKVVSGCVCTSTRLRCLSTNLAVRRGLHGAAHPGGGDAWWWCVAGAASCCCARRGKIGGCAQRGAACKLCRGECAVVSVADVCCAHTFASQQSPPAAHTCSTLLPLPSSHTTAAPLIYKQQHTQCSERLRT